MMIQPLLGLSRFQERRSVDKAALSLEAPSLKETVWELVGKRVRAAQCHSNRYLHTCVFMCTCVRVSVIVTLCVCARVNVCVWVCPCVSACVSMCVCVSMCQCVRPCMSRYIIALVHGISILTQDFT